MNNSRQPLDLVARIDHLAELRLATIQTLRDSLHPQHASQLCDLPSLTARRGWLVWTSMVRSLLDSLRREGDGRGVACCALALQTLDGGLLLLASDLFANAWERVA